MGFFILFELQLVFSICSALLLTGILGSCFVVHGGGERIVPDFGSDIDVHTW